MVPVMRGESRKSIMVVEPIKNWLYFRMLGLLIGLSPVDDAQSP